MSILNTILGAAGPLLAGPTGGASMLLPALSSVLGGAAKGSADTNTAQAGAKLANQKLNIDTPTLKARRALAAGMAKNYSPQTVQWGGPGSGLKGQLPTFSGGVDSALPAAMNDPMVMELMNNVMMGKDASYKDPTKSSILDKILGGAGLATSILGTFSGLGANKLPGQLPKP